MYCTRCGTQNPDDAGFCRNCSNPLVKPGGTQPQGNPYTTPTSYGAHGAGQPQQPGQTPYPGYQGHPVYQSGQAYQQIAQQGSASGRSIAAMVLSILGIVGCGFLTSIPGMILGKMEMNAISAGQAPKAGEVLAKIGFYLGIAGTVLSCLLGLIWAVLTFVGAAANSFQ